MVVVAPPEASSATLTRQSLAQMSTARAMRLPSESTRPRSRAQVMPSGPGATSTSTALPMCRLMATGLPPMKTLSMVTAGSSTLITTG